MTYPYKEEVDSVMVYLYAILSFISLLVLILLLIITYKVVKIIHCADKMLLGVLLFLDMTMITKMVFFLMNVYSLVDEKAEVSPYIGVFVSIAPIMFLAFAVILNISKWIYFHMIITSRAKDNFNNLDRNVMILGCITIVVLVLIMFIVAWKIADTIETSDP